MKQNQPKSIQIWGIVCLICLSFLTFELNATPQEPCIAFPTGVTFSGVRPNGFIVSWNSLGEGYQYQVGYREKNTTEWKISPTIFSPNTKCALSQLKSFADYEIQVRAKCNTQPEFGDWSNTSVGVKTSEEPSVLCSGKSPKAPSQIKLTNITENSALINWSNIPDAAGTAIVYGLASESPSKWKEIILCKSSDSYQISGLISGAKYRIRVRTLCTQCSTQNNNNKKSPWGVIPDFTTLKVQTMPVITGIVMDEKLAPVSNATVTIDGKNTRTNSEGKYFLTSNRTERIIVGAEHPDFLPRKVGFVSTKGDTLYKNVLLEKFTTTHTFKGDHAMLLGNTAFTLQLPEKAIINEATGELYSGNVSACIKSAQPGEPMFGERMPGGDFSAINAQGEPRVLYSYGFFGCELRGENGEKLNLANDKKAKVAFKLSDKQLSKAQATVPLWHFDETNAIWKEEGIATLDNKTYFGEVSHFSSWNCDWAGPRSWVEGEALACNGTKANGGTVYAEQIPTQIDNKGFYRCWVPAQFDVDMYSSTQNKEYSVPKLQPEETHKVPAFMVNSLKGFGFINDMGYLKIYQCGGNGKVDYSVDNGQTFQASPEFQFSKDDTITRKCVIKDEKGCENRFETKILKKYLQDCELVDDNTLVIEGWSSISEFLQALQSGNPKHCVSIDSDNEFLTFQENKGLMGCLQGITVNFCQNINESQILESLLSSLQLQFIIIENQKLITVPSLSRWKNLTYLSLGLNQLASLSSEVGEWKSLTGLNLQSNRLTNLPKEVREWKNLKQLSLADNQLTTLPAEVGEWINLTELNLSNNQLTSLPASVGQWKSLIYLNLNYNQLTTLPAEVGEWKGLTHLYLIYNQLTTLPSAVGEWKSLQYLDLDNNQLISLPPEIANLKDKLEYLFLRGNNFSQEEKDKIKSWLPNTNITW